MPEAYEMKVLVAYRSITGNTKKIAEAIFNEIQVVKEIKEVDEVTSLEGYDLSFLGFPMEWFGPSEKVKQFLENYTKGKTIALFITPASPEEGGTVLEGWLENFKQAASDANLVGLFNCQGQLSQQIKQYMLSHSNPDYRRWAEGDTSQGQPDKARVERARRFAAEIMEKVK
jgi:flavodoxin